MVIYLNPLIHTNQGELNGAQIFETIKKNLCSIRDSLKNFVKVFVINATMPNHLIGILNLKPAMPVHQLATFNLQ